jgi:ankyrin repeat protein
MSAVVIIIIICIILIGGGAFGYMTIMKKKEAEEKLRKANENIITSSEDNKLSLFNLAISDGADLDFRDNEGNNALMIASKKGNSKIVKKYLELISKKNKDLINKRSSSTTYTPLMYAAENDHLNIVKLLINKKINSKMICNINLITRSSKQNEDTALSMALKYKNIDISKFLINNNSIKLDIENKNGDIALLIALKKNLELELVSNIIDKCSDDDLKHENKDGEDALFLAVNQNKQKYVEILFKKFEKTTQKDIFYEFFTSKEYDNKTLYEIAKLNKNSEIAQLLAEKFTDFLFKKFYDKVVNNDPSKLVRNGLDVNKLYKINGEDLYLLDVIINAYVINDDSNPDILLKTLKYLISNDLNYKKKIIPSQDMEYNILMILSTQKKFNDVSKYLFNLDKDLAYEKLININGSYKKNLDTLQIMMTIPNSLDDNIDLFKILYNDEKCDKEEIYKFYVNDDERETTLLKLAIEKGKYEIVKEIVNNTSKKYIFHVGSNDQKDNALQLALERNERYNDAGSNILYEEISKIYVEKLDMDVKFGNALSSGSVEEFKESMEYFGYDINMEYPIHNNEDNHKSTLLHLAIESGHSDLVNYILENGFENINFKAYTNAYQNHKTTPLFLALLTNNDLIAENILKLDNINVNEKLKFQGSGDMAYSYIMLCLMYGLDKPAELIIKNPSYDIEKNNDDLVFAVNFNNPTVIQFLLDKGLDPNKKETGMFNASAIEKAEQKNLITIVNLLKSYKINTSATTPPVTETFDQSYLKKNNFIPNIKYRYYNVFLEE